MSFPIHCFCQSICSQRRESIPLFVSSTINNVYIRQVCLWCPQPFYHGWFFLSPVLLDVSASSEMTALIVKVAEVQRLDFVGKKQSFRRI